MPSWPTPPLSDAATATSPSLSSVTLTKVKAHIPHHAINPGYIPHADWRGNRAADLAATHASGCRHAWQMQLVSDVLRRKKKLSPLVHATQLMITDSLLEASQIYALLKQVGSTRGSDHVNIQSPHTPPRDSFLPMMYSARLRPRAGEGTGVTSYMILSFGCGWRCGSAPSTVLPFALCIDGV